jgi:hypothetical protein
VLTTSDRSSEIGSKAADLFEEDVASIATTPSMTP